MRILQLCKKFPYPLKDGESIAVTYLGKAMRDIGCKVDLLAMNTTKHPTDLNQLPADFNHYHRIETVPVDNRLRMTDALANLFSRDSYHISRFEDPIYAQNLRKLLWESDYDIVQLETLYLAPYIPLIRQHSSAAIIMRAHNVEHEIWERYTRNTRFWPKKAYLHYLTRKLRRYELSVINDYDFLAAITKRDLDIFRALGCDRPGMVTPIGLDIRDYPPDDTCFEQPLSLSFIGSLDWMPNLEGLDWFLAQVWPHLRQQWPHLRLHVAGRHTPRRLLELREPGVFVEGEVPSAQDFINAHPVMVVPLLSGSGMRAKILEGMALGKVIISTRLGMEGIAAEHGKNALLAETAEDFIRQLDFLTAVPGKALALGKAARSLVAANYDNRQIAIQLATAYESLLLKRSTTTPFRS